MILRKSESLLLEILDGEGPCVIIFLSIVSLEICLGCPLGVGNLHSYWSLYWLLHGRQNEISCLKLVLALSGHGIRIVLASEHSEVSLSELERTVLKHPNLVQRLPAFVCEGISIPHAVLFDTEQIENLLETALQDADCALVRLILLLNLLGVLLRLVNFIHNILQLLSSLLEFSVRGISYTVGSVPRNLLLNVSDFFN